MEKKALELLIAKFVGVSSKILEGIANKLAKNSANEEELATLVEGVTFQQVLDSYGDKRATEASVSAVANYEKKHNLKDGKSLEEPKPEPKPDPKPDPKPEPKADPKTDPKPEPKKEDDVPAYLKAFMEAQAAQNKQLTETITALQGQITTINKNKLTETRSARLQGVIAKLTDAQKKPYAHISLDSMSDAEFDEFINETSETAKEIEKANAAAKTVQENKPRVGNYAPDNSKASKEEIDSVVSKIVK